MTTVVPVFRVPTGMTGKALRMWIAPESIPLVTGPPFDPEAWSALQAEEKIVLDSDVEIGYTSKTGVND